jgi:hypothetical protein
MQANQQVQAHSLKRMISEQGCSCRLHRDRCHGT